jgi:hypothetical protein
MAPRMGDPARQWAARYRAREPAGAAARRGVMERRGLPLMPSGAITYEVSLANNQPVLPESTG